MRLAIALVSLLLFSIPSLAEEDVPYSVAEFSDTLGNHRAIIRVAEKADGVMAHVPWRRRDRDVEKKQLTVVDSATGKAVPMARLSVNREFADILFRPASGAGVYYFYYAPYKIQPGSGGYSGAYLPAETADVKWLGDALEKGTWKQWPKAQVTAIEARSEFERFDPMEVVATRDELAGLLEKHPGAYLVFAEDRKYPIRMNDELPLRWIRSGPVTRLQASAERNEYFAFQVGIFAARENVGEIAIEFEPLKSAGAEIPGSAFTCFNLCGVDWLGRPFTKTVTVDKGRVQALWCGIDIPKSAKPGEYLGGLTIRPKNGAATRVALALAVADTVRQDRGDNETWRHSRLRWLNSTIGIVDEPVAPYTPMAVDGQVVKCLGRSVELSPSGLPSQIKAGETALLAGPIALSVDGTMSASGKSTFTKQVAGVVEWQANSSAGPVAVSCAGNMEFDGHMHYTLTCSVKDPLDVKDMRLELPIRREAAPYFMGMGQKGGNRPKDLNWKWGGRVYYDSFWIGGVPAGLQCELRGTSYSGPMVNLYWPMGQLQAPPAWNNGGKGGCTMAESGDTVMVRAYTGPRTLKPGEPLTLEFAFLITPVKPLDTAAHLKSRYYHAYHDINKAQQAGANVINIHHATAPNPFINYPFIATDKLKAYVKDAHDRGMKLKIYYTVRELTNHTTELFALRSLGNEILAPGLAGGYPWLREHLVGDYTPAWYDRSPGGDVCAAIVTSGASRWYNYYIEGLRWLLANTDIDGLYLDDVTYDRETLKRMRKTMAAAKKGCMIDLHSNTAFSHQPANQYMEFFPYIDRLWFGESFNYNESPDYWLIEISGIPFGLMGEMLQDGGNPWRGMIYGMTSRMPWSGNPGELWKAWDQFGIVDSKMIGYWDASCPIRTDNPDVLATAYIRQGRTMIALASWAKTPVDCRLKVDWKALGLDESKATLTAPEIKEFQSARAFKSGEAIPVVPGRGWLIVLQ